MVYSLPTILILSNGSVAMIFHTHSPQMLPLHFPSLINKQPLSIPGLYHFIKNYNNVDKQQFTLSSRRRAHGDVQLFKGKSKSQSSSFVVHAVEKDSKQYEIDPEKAREALLKLDQQLEALSKKQVNPPKIKASDVKLTRDEATKEEDVAEASGNVLVYLTTFLFLFTIFYNILFYTVIKPSVDGPEPILEPDASIEIAGSAIKEFP